MTKNFEVELSKQFASHACIPSGFTWSVSAEGVDLGQQYLEPCVPGLMADDTKRVLSSKPRFERKET
jgi:hypothetical protein